VELHAPSDIDLGGRGRHLSRAAHQAHLHLLGIAKAINPDRYAPRFIPQGSLACRCHQR
jgi:hypothetical protein